MNGKIVTINIFYEIMYFKTFVSKQSSNYMIKSAFLAPHNNNWSIVKQ